MTKGAELNGLLGQNADFEGELSCTGDIMLEGRFKGKLSVRGTLFIGEGAEIEADVHAARVVIAGRFRGNIVADEKIEFSRPGKFYGNIQAPAIVIDEGARFEGNCRMKPMKKPDEGELRNMNSKSSGFDPILISSQSAPQDAPPTEPSH